MYLSKRRIEKHIRSENLRKLDELYHKSSFADKIKILECMVARWNVIFKKYLMLGLEDGSKSVRKFSAEMILKLSLGADLQAKAERILKETQAHTKSSHDKNDAVIKFEKRNWTAIIKEQLKAPMR